MSNNEAQRIFFDKEFQNFLPFSKCGVVFAEVFKHSRDVFPCANDVFVRVAEPFTILRYKVAGVDDNFSADGGGAFLVANLVENFQRTIRTVHFGKLFVDF